MNRKIVAKELLKVAKDLVGGETDRELFKLYNKYQKKPYLKYSLKTKDSIGNERQIWARIYIKDGEKLIVSYQGVGGWGKSGMPISLSYWGLSNSDFPKIRVMIDDDLEKGLLGAKSTAQRSKLVNSVTGGFQNKAMRAVRKGYDDLVDVELKAF